MTLVVCVACGTRKFGALLPCSECGHAPGTPDEQAKALILSDHVMDPDHLEGISARIGSGETIDFPEDVLRAWTESPPAAEDQQALFEPWRQESELSGRRMRRGLAGVALVAVWWFAT